MGCGETLCPPFTHYSYMAPSTFSNRGTVECVVLISAGESSHVCRAMIDADCWPADGRHPAEIGGFLDLPRPEWEVSSDRVVLKVQSTGEIYRVIVDGSNGRFIGRRL
jgi:hypothetical protein